MEYLIGTLITLWICLWIVALVSMCVYFYKDDFNFPVSRFVMFPYIFGTLCGFLAIPLFFLC